MKSYLQEHLKVEGNQYIKEITERQMLVSLVFNKEKLGELEGQASFIDDDEQEYKETLTGMDLLTEYTERGLEEIFEKGGLDAEEYNIEKYNNCFSGSKIHLNATSNYTNEIFEYAVLAALSATGVITEEQYDAIRPGLRQLKEDNLKVIQEQKENQQEKWAANLEKLRKEAEDRGSKKEIEPRGSYTEEAEKGSLGKSR